MANGTIETLTPDGDADEERGIQLAELYANWHTLEEEFRTETDVPEQRTPTHDKLEDNDQQPTKPVAVEGGKSLYGTFDQNIRFAGGLSIEGTIRGREIARINRRRVTGHIGRYVMPRVLPGGL